MDVITKKLRKLFLKYEDIIYILLFIELLNFGFYIRIVQGDPLRNYCFFAALFFLLLTFIIIERIRLFSLTNIVSCIAICIVGGWRFIYWYRCGSIHVCKSIISITASGCLFAIFLISYIIERKYIGFEKINKIYISMLVLALIILTVSGSFNKGIKYILVLLLVMIVCMPSYDKCLKFITPFCCAYIFLAIYMIAEIYITEGGFVHQGLGKYAPALPPAVATFFNGALISALVLFIKEFLDKKRFLILFIYTITSILLFFGISVCGSRIALGGGIFSIIFTYYYLLNLHKKCKIRRVSTLVLLVLAVLLIIGLVFVANLSEDVIDEYVHNNFLNSKLHFWNIKISATLYNYETKVILPAGSFWNNLDYFFSDRISYWKVYCGQLNLWGHENLGLYIAEDYFATHPHNDYIAWLYWYGIIPGTMLIGWFVYVIVSATRLMKNDKKTGYIVFLYVYFIAIVQLTDTSFFFRDFTFIIFMLMQYPIIYSEEIKGLTKLEIS